MSALCFDNLTCLIIISASLRASNVQLSMSHIMALKQSISRKTLAISLSCLGEMNLPVFSTVSHKLHMSVPLLAMTTV